MTETPVPLGWMRSVYALQAAFALESFIDELAVAAGKDPLQYRLHLLAKDQDLQYFTTTWHTARMRGVLQLAAEKAGWRQASSRWSLSRNRLLWLLRVLHGGSG